MNDPILELDQFAAPDQALTASPFDLSELRDSKKFVAYSLGGKRYCTPAADVSAVVELPHVSALPNAPRPIAGIAASGGNIFAVLDAGELLGAEHFELHDCGKAVLLRGLEGETRFAIPFDGSHAMLNIPSENAVQYSRSALLAGEIKYGDETIGLLDADAISKEVERHFDKRKNGRADGKTI